MTESTADRAPATSPAGAQPMPEICDAIADGPDDSILMCDLVPGEHVLHFYRLYSLYWRVADNHA